MKRFWGFVKKEFYHILRDPRTLIIILGIPLAQLLLFGFVITTDVKDVKIAIFDKSNDYATHRIINKLLSSGYFILEQNLQSDNEVEAIFKKGKVKEVIVFESDFAQKLEREGTASVQLLADASDPNIARLVVNYTSGIMNNFTMNEHPLMKMPMQIKTSVRMFYNEEMKSVYTFVPGLMTLIMMIISAMMSSISITREKEMGTMEVLLVSPLNPLMIIIGKVVPYLIISFIDALLIILLGNTVFHMPINGSIALLFAESFLFIFLALCVGIFISTVAPNQLIAMFISMIGLMLPTLLLSGFIFPVENMPKPLQIFSTIMPARWFIVVVKGIMLKGVGLTVIWRETLIMIGMSIVFIGLSVKRFKIRIE